MVYHFQTRLSADREYSIPSCCCEHEDSCDRYKSGRCGYFPGLCRVDMNYGFLHGNCTVRLCLPTDEARSRKRWLQSSLEDPFTVPKYLLRTTQVSGGYEHVIEVYQPCVEGYWRGWGMVCLGVPRTLLGDSSTQGVYLCWM